MGIYVNANYLICSLNIYFTNGEYEVEYVLEENDFLAIVAICIVTFACNMLFPRLLP